MFTKKYIYTYIKPDTNVYFISSKIVQPEYKKYSMKGLIYSEPYGTKKNEEVNAVIAYDDVDRCLLKKAELLQINEIRKGLCEDCETDDENCECIEIRDMQLLDMQTYCNELRMPLNVIINTYCNLDDKIEYNEIYFYKYKGDDEYMNFQKYKGRL